MKIKVEKVSAGRMGEWPSEPYIDMRDEPDGPADFSTIGWVFEFRGNFYGASAHPQLKNQRHYCRWLIPSQSCYEVEAVKEVFLKRCRAEGVTFVYLFKTIPPPSTAQVRQVEEFNAKLEAERKAAEAA